MMLNKANEASLVSILPTPMRYQSNTELHFIISQVCAELNNQAHTQSLILSGHDVHVFSCLNFRDNV